MTTWAQLFHTNVYDGGTEFLYESFTTARWDEARYKNEASHKYENLKWSFISGQREYYALESKETSSTV